MPQTLRAASVSRHYYHTNIFPRFVFHNDEKSIKLILSVNLYLRKKQWQNCTNIYSSCDSCSPWLKNANISAICQPKSQGRSSRYTAPQIRHITDNHRTNCPLTLRRRHNTANFLQKCSQQTPHSSPVRARYGVSVVIVVSDSLSATIITMSGQTRPRYNGT